jgi:hypothetical protein
MAHKSFSSGALQSKLLILGLGTAGHNFALLLQVAENFSPSCEFEIRGIDSFNAGLDAYDFERATIQSLISRATKVLLVVYGGGDSGAEMSRFAALQARQGGTPIHSILTLPFEWEGSRRTKKALVLLNALLEGGSSVQTLDCNDHLNPDTDSWVVLFDRVNTALLSSIRDFVRLN